MALSNAFSSGFGNPVAAGLQLRQQREQTDLARTKQLLDTYGDARERAVKTANTIMENALIKRENNPDYDMGPALQAVEQIKSSQVRTAQALAGAGMPIDPNVEAQRFDMIKTQPTIGEKQQVEAAGEGRKAAAKEAQTGETKTWYDPETDSFREIRTTNQAAIDEAIRKGMFQMNPQLVTEDTGGLTKSQAGKLQTGMIEDEIALRQNVANIEPIIDMISSDDFIGGTTGQALQLVNSAVQQFRQATGTDSVLQNGKLDEDKLDISEENMTRFRRAAATGDRIDSAILELAFLRAKSLNPDGKISDADVRAAQKILGEGADKAARITLLRDLQDRMVRNYNISGRIRSRALGRDFDPVRLEELRGESGKVTPTTADEVAEQILKDEGLDEGL